MVLEIPSFQHEIKWPTFESITIDLVSSRMAVQRLDSCGEVNETFPTMLDEGNHHETVSLFTSERAPSVWTRRQACFVNFSMFFALVLCFKAKNSSLNWKNLSKRGSWFPLGRQASTFLLRMGEINTHACAMLGKQALYQDKEGLTEWIFCVCICVRLRTGACQMDPISQREVGKPLAPFPSFSLLLRRCTDRLVRTYLRFVPRPEVLIQKKISTFAQVRSNLACFLTCSKNVKKQSAFPHLRRSDNIANGPPLHWRIRVTWKARVEDMDRHSLENVWQTVSE